jgi:NitT/TauT family transport system substrate-binding protein/sulfonate transport system substrate-binding protein
VKHIAGRALTLVLVAGVAVACSSGGSSDSGDNAGGSPGATQGSDTQFKTVDVGAVTDITALPLFAASQQGYFASNGLDVKFRTFSSGSDMNKALAAGTVQFATASATSIPSSRAAGLLTTMIAGTVNDATQNEYDASLGIVGRAASGVKANDPQSLKGKKVAILAGSTTDFYFTSWLKQNGLTADDVKTVSISVPDMPVSLKQGNVDAVVSWEPYVSQEIREMGSDGVVVSRGAPGNVAFIIGMGATDKTVKEDADVLTKITAAVAQADQWVRQNPEKAATVATSYIKGLDPADALAAIKQVHFDPRLSVCTQHALEESAQTMQALGKIKTAPSVSEIAHPEFIEQAEKDHPEWFSDLPALPDNCAASSTPASS